MSASGAKPKTGEEQEWLDAKTQAMIMSKGQELITFQQARRPIAIPDIKLYRSKDRQSKNQFIENLLIFCETICHLEAAITKVYNSPRPPERPSPLPVLELTPGEEQLIEDIRREDYLKDACIRNQLIEIIQKKYERRSFHNVTTLIDGPVFQKLFSPSHKGYDLNLVTAAGEIALSNQLSEIYKKFYENSVLLDYIELFSAPIKKLPPNLFIKPELLDYEKKGNINNIHFQHDLRGLFPAGLEIYTIGQLAKDQKLQFKEKLRDCIFALEDKKAIPFLEKALAEDNNLLAQIFQAPRPKGGFFSDSTEGILKQLEIKLELLRNDMSSKSKLGPAVKSDPR